MSGEIHLQDINLNEAKDRPANPYVSCVNRQSRGTEAGSDYLSLVEEDQEGYIYTSTVSRHSKGIEVGSDYDPGTECVGGKENEAISTRGDIKHGEKKQDRQTPEPRNTSASIVRTGFLTKKRLVLGAVVVVIIVAIVSVVTSLTLGKNRDEQLKNNKKTMICPNVPSTGMSYPEAGKTGIQGRRFLICFTNTYPDAKNQSKTIYVLSDEDFEFELISNLLNTTQLYKEEDTRSKQIKKIRITNAIALSSYFKIEHKALLIKTTRDASVIIIDNSLSSSDSTVILPMESISTSYIISAAFGKFNNTFPNSQFAIASRENGTVIKIYFHLDPDWPFIADGVTYRNGSVMILVLNELETYQMGHRVDTSGTLIEATSPVAVFSGSFCEKIAFEKSSESGYCSKLDEQLPPIDRLDNMYIVPPNYNRLGTVLKIISPFENHIIYKIGNKQEEKTLKSSEYFEITFLHDEVVVIDSKKPVLVTSFASGSDVTGDPYMITVPGIRQYTDKYLVIVPGNFEKSYIALMAEEKSMNNIVINDTEIIQYLNDRKFYAPVTIRDIKFVVLVFQVSGGMLRIKSTNNAAFGLVVYGHRLVDGHGFAGKAVLPDICVNSYE